MSAGRRALLPTAEQERIIGHWLSRCGRAVSTNARPLLLNLMDHQAVCESPSQARLMEELALGERPLRQALTELEGLGFLAVTRYAGRPSRYQVNVETILARIEGPDREPEHSRGVSPGAESDANLLRSAGTSRLGASIPPPPDHHHLTTTTCARDTFRATSREVRPHR